MEYRDTCRICDVCPAHVTRQGGRWPQRTVMEVDDEVPAEREERYPTRDRNVPQRYGMGEQNTPVYV